MDFYLLVGNLFIQEGIRSILINKYSDVEVSILQNFEDYKNEFIKEHGIFITDNPSVFYNYQPKLKNLFLKKQIKTILIVNMAQIEQIKEKDLQLVNALIYTNCSLNDLEEALSFIQSGLTYRCRKFKPEHVNQNTFENLLNEQQVSLREVEIIKLVIKGHTSQEIAEILNISYYTVTTHRRNINKKLNLKNPHDLLRLSLDQRV